MNSMIYTGRLTHVRSHPVSHAFSYPVFFYAIDIDELDLLGAKIWLFSHNRFNVVSIHDRDYLSGEGNIKQKVLSVLKSKGISGVSKILLITSARFFSYAFNPVNFYYCYDLHDEIVCILTEVNNTFQERHLYVLEKCTTNPDGTMTFEQAKEFHVSPFNNMGGHYRMTFSLPGDSISINIALIHGDKIILNARIQGNARPLNTLMLQGAITRFPVSAFLTLARIHKEAFKLYFIKKLQYHPKPSPSNHMTMSSRKPGIGEKAGLWFFKKVFSKSANGHLSVMLPDKKVIVFGDPAETPGAEVSVLNWTFFWRFIRDGEIGLGESYVDRNWDSEDMLQLLDFYIVNIEVLGKNSGMLIFFSNLYRLITFSRFRNTRKRARRNIESHYDLGNELFRLFLDTNLLYSCAIFHSPDESLEQAQLNKIDSFIRKTGIRKGDRVLEIGSGWGGFAIEAVKRTGCHVTTVTLSEEQYSYVSEKIRELGLSDQIEVRLQDYRDIRGSFDKIISIEMLEAVGFEYYGLFFRQCEKLLAPHGTIGLQVITMPDCRFDDYRRQVDWLQTYIFPGGCLPSLHALNEAMKKNSLLHIEHLENIGFHYARTLQIWRERFLANLDKLPESKYDEKFRRTWLFYLYTCESAFKNRMLNDLQLILTRQGNHTITLKPN